MVRIKNIALMSAAGSGKTHELTKRFLYLFLHKNTYPLESLFAITFTRAAAFEMKSRIINYLDVLAKGNSVKYEEGTRESDILNFFTSIYPEPELRRIAAERRNYLLNNLSSLNVSTFHSLFATFLSVIPFEAGILPDYDIVEEEELLLEQAVDKYLDLAYSNSISAKAVLEIIAFEEKSVKNLLVGSFKEYKPWLSYFIELNNRKEQLLQESKRHKEELLVRLREYRNFVKENIEATYTKKGTINNYWSKFLEKIEDFISVQDFDTLAEIIPYFITEDGMRQNYFSDFEKHIDNLARYRETILKIRESMVFFLEALSNKEMIIKFQPLLEIHRIFQEEKKKQNVITFSDIEDYILSVLKENLELNYLYFKLGADIKHLMIDEFQDTSYKQIDILIPVIEEITAYNPEEKSLYYVGDPHQAIFRWRQGAPELFDELKEMYKGKISGEKLDKNYRSKEEIIKFVNKVLDKNDKADPQNKGGWLRIEEVGEYFADEGREICINRTAEIVKELKHCGYKESEIAILTRKNDFAAEVGTVLSKSGIPCLSMAEASIMDEPDIHFIIHLLKFLDDPENDFSLFHILTSDVFNLSEEVIRSIKMKRKPLYLTLRSHHPDWEVTKKLNELISLVYFMNPYQLVFHICKYLDLQISYPLASLLDAAITYIGEGCGS
ncbi:MAG: UvrD-helicase domain-containing protein, partial [candidate division WOR-3 bacterium]